MADTLRSLFDYRETHTLDSGGEGIKPAPPLRGRGCGRKRKGTPMKVFLTHTEEECVPERSFSPGDRKEAAENQRLDGPFYNAELAPHHCSPSAQTHDKVSSGPRTGSCSASTPAAAASSAPPAPAPSLSPASTVPAAPTASAPAPTTSPYPPSPNCRIREVHCGSQVRLVVIAIRDITKGEEITVDYSLTEWGENLSFRGPASPAQHECISDSENNNNIKKEEEPLSVDSDSAEEDNASPRGRAQQQRKKRRNTPSKIKTPHRTLAGRSSLASPNSIPPHNRPLSSSHPPAQSSPPSSSSAKPVFKAPAPHGSIIKGISSANAPRGVSIDAMRQTCEHCGRHFRSLGRHLDKHHSHQPEVCSALVERYTQMPRLHPQSTNPPTAHTHSPQDSKSPQSERQSSELPQIGAQDLSMPPPTLTAANQSPASSGRNSTSPVLTPPQGQSAVLVSVLKRSPPPVAKDNDLMSGSGRHHMLPLLSSLSSLVLYLRRLQHSAFLSLSLQLQSAEAWRLLCHSSLALLILYNRRRECEVSKLSITEYRARITPQCPVPVPPGAPPALTPLEASLSPFERLVLPHLPRVGVQGKRGRVQPLILPPHCEPCLELLLQTRQDVGVDPANPYVFARPYHSPATPLRGTDLLRSLARSSGTRNPRALTQTRVRRQVAILTQLLLLGEGEEPGQPGGSAVERLEHFLEREYHVTQNCAGIGQDPGLMGRVGRVVLCGERDGVLFRGMSLNHICLELDVMSGNSADSYSEGEKGKNNGRVGRPKKLKNSQPALPSAPPSSTHQDSGQPKSGKRGVLKRPWSEAERAAVEEHLTQNITDLRVPAKADCERCLQQCPLLVSNHRDWRAIKFYCHNRIQLLKKNQRREIEPLALIVC
ncbi:hypothetical protein JOQ06_013860 [Pogonophryne albipinna]|uniref:SET domain-containing protein n=1 Tax=Pogonophryne albipinna TaxID=1090488 RepID=A0AAD6FRQ3_9TELE|nr:hypothetical protein JOQ06_013860 [Pogonophryne albipinna]